MRGGINAVVCKMVGWGSGGTIYIYKQQSILNTGNVNVEFKLLTHNQYLVLNGFIVRQIRPSFLTLQTV